MKATFDKTAYAEAMLDLPFAVPHANSASGAFVTPGCHVKSREMRGSWPRFFGRLVSYDADAVVVVSKPPTHGVDGMPTVWTGTFSEYAQMWRCD